MSLQSENRDEFLNEPIPCSRCGKDHPLREKENYERLNFLQNESYENMDRSEESIFLKVFDSKIKEGKSFI
jgi:hypothetical protein